AADLGAAREWAGSWRELDSETIRLDYHTVGGRLIGTNELPRRVWIEDWDQLWSLLGVAGKVRRFMALLEQTRIAAPALADWALERPLQALDLAEVWDKILATVLWIDTTAGTNCYLRQIDVPGVDTKFIEQHQRILARLLDRHLSPERIDTGYPTSDFAARYGFRRKPQYVRFRWLDPSSRTAGFAELTVRLNELASRPPDADTVVIVENEVTYLALPEIPRTLAIFGGGYALSRLDTLTWLSDRRIRYWGDIDTHGFAILDRLRASHPHTESVLMDRATMLAHEGQWVSEPAPFSTPLNHLTDSESDLYHDLVQDTFGPAAPHRSPRLSI
ncbi:Wadjet anti-phage system protein JetD domain-containing protein, partial [Nocardia sp. NPDC004722]